MKLYFILISWMLMTAVIFSSGCPVNTKTTEGKSVASPSKTPPNSTAGNSNQNMKQENLTAVPESIWGANGIGLQVEENGAHIQFACADGEISQKLMVNENGEFSADGVYMQMRPGPTRLDSPPERQPAQYEGVITGDSMKLKIKLKKTDKEIADFTLERGKTPRIVRCQ